MLIKELDVARYGDARRKRSLFLPKYLKKIADDKRLEGKAFDQAHAIMVKWADLEKSGKLKSMNETALQGEFLTEVFGNALGYTLFSENLEEWNLQTHFSVPDGQADAAIGNFAPDISEDPSACR